MKYVSHKELYKTLLLIKSWINNCDTKISVLLTGIGVFAGVFLTSDYMTQFIKICQFAYNMHIMLFIIYVCICVILLAVSTYGCINLTLALKARINPNQFKSKGIYSDSLIFFASIAKYDNVQKYKEQLEKCTREQMEDDIISQIYICASICTQKFSYYKIGLKYSLSGLFGFMAMEIAGMAVMHIMGNQS